MTRVQSNTNTTIDNRQGGVSSQAARNTLAAYGSKEKDMVNQTQKLQNNFFFQPASPRDSADNIHNINRGEVVSPHSGSGYQGQRNARTAAGGARQRAVSKNQNNSGLYHQLQIQTTQSPNMTMPYYGHPQTTNNSQAHGVVKSFDFNKYRKDQPGNTNLMANIIPHTNVGFSSP